MRSYTGAMRRALPLCLAAALLLTGCGTKTAGRSTTATSAAPPATATTGPSDTQPKGQTLRVYFLRDDRVAPVARTVPRTQAVARAALAQLVAGPTVEERGQGLISEVPHETELRGLTIAGGEATVDFTGSSFWQEGQRSSPARFAQVVYTLTQFPTVQRVRFEADGKPLPGLVDGNSKPLDHPASRSDYEWLTPAILVESPLPEEAVTSPLEVRGTANTFEATFQLEVLGADDAVLARQFVTATSGSGQRGTFAVSVPVAAKPGPIRLRVWEDDAATGKPTHQVELTIRLVR